MSGGIGGSEDPQHFLPELLAGACLRARPRLGALHLHRCPRADAATVQSTSLDRVSGIQVSRQSVIIAGDVKTRDVMAVLDGNGCVLRTVPYLIDQTVAGAVSNCTHVSEHCAGL